MLRHAACFTTSQYAAAEEALWAPLGSNRDPRRVGWRPHVRERRTCEDFNNLLIHLPPPILLAAQRDILEEMDLNGIAPNLAILQSMLANANTAKNLGDATFYFDKMRQAGMPVTQENYASLIANAGKSRHMGYAVQLLGEMKARGLDVARPVYFALVQAFAAIGMHEEVQALIDEQRARGLAVIPYQHCKLLKAIRVAGENAVMAEGTQTQLLTLYATGLPARPLMRTTDVPGLVHGALEQGIAAASIQAPGGSDDNADSNGGKGEQLKAEGFPDPVPDPSSPAEGTEPVALPGDAGTSLHRKALPVISEAINTLQALGFHNQALALYSGLTEQQRASGNCHAHYYVISSYLKEASGHFRGPTVDELEKAMHSAKTETETQREAEAAKMAAEPGAEPYNASKRVSDGVKWSSVFHEATQEAKRALHARHCNTAAWARAAELFEQAQKLDLMLEHKLLEEIVRVSVMMDFLGVDSALAVGVDAVDHALDRGKRFSFAETSRLLKEASRPHVSDLCLAHKLWTMASRWDTVPLWSALGTYRGALEFRQPERMELREKVLRAIEKRRKLDGAGVQRGALQPTKLDWDPSPPAIPARPAAGAAKASDELEWSLSEGSESD
ncbi:hypothetical protein WJX81_007956 [Elliptochloris bilobata]|uniref:Pentacotripeptide-repeat region of PRORP domain-containing protein n=1 Tax=Elliptochloris bilobata TaxID=381761 RepID=A0AAW1SLN7_9CHLO